MEALLGLAVGVALGFATAFIGYRFDVAKATRDQRLKAYLSLWKTTGVVPLWPKNNALTYAQLARLRTELRDWYFAEGGLLLSTTAREVYGNVQKVLSALFEPPAVSPCPGHRGPSPRMKWRRWRAERRRRCRLPDPPPPPDEPKAGLVQDPDYELVRCALSCLRTQLTLDLASRKGTIFGV